jgi:DNA repair exonuclease SbcCD ATPase subunit
MSFLLPLSVLLLCVICECVFIAGRRRREGGDGRVEVADKMIESRISAEWPASGEQRLALDSEISEDATDIGSLISAVRSHALDLRGEHARSVSSLSVNFDLLNARLSTVEPLLTRLRNSASQSEASAAALALSNDDLMRKLSEAERELAIYRPEASRLAEDLRTARAKLMEIERGFAALEAEHANMQAERNDLSQKTASAEIARERAIEEKNVLLENLKQHDFTIQSLLREAAHLKSEAVQMAGDLERAEGEAKSLADKYAAELEANSRGRDDLQSIQRQFEQFRDENKAKDQQSTERETFLMESLSTKEKQLYESEIKRAALTSKNAFLERANQRLREDSRRHIDHMGNLEASNQKMLESLSRASSAEEDKGGANDEPSASDRSPVKLRALADGQTSNSGPPKAASSDQSK